MGLVNSLEWLKMVLLHPTLINAVKSQLIGAEFEAIWASIITTWTMAKISFSSAVLISPILIVFISIALTIIFSLCSSFRFVEFLCSDTFYPLATGAKNQLKQNFRDKYHWRSVRCCVYNGKVCLLTAMPQQYCLSMTACELIHSIQFSAPYSSS